MAFDESTLVAYVDGELDAETTNEIERALTQDPAAAKTVEALQDSASAVRRALNGVINEPIPDRLLRVVAGQSEHGTLAQRKKKRWFGSVPRAALRLAAAIAFLMIGFGGGYYFHQALDPYSYEIASGGTDTEEANPNDLLYKALEQGAVGEEYSGKSTPFGTHGSVSVVQNLRVGSGHVCREFRSVLRQGKGTETKLGIGCRNPDGSWETLFLQPEGSKK